jgi:hypothetical protein
MSGSQGFTETRDADGMCYPYGTWNHCMELVGWFLNRSGNLCSVIRQSWRESDSPNGPNVITTKSGRKVELPPGCFGAPGSAIDQNIRNGNDTWAISGLQGFKPRSILWGSVLA